MPRRARKTDESEPELNLAPIMNMVVILIPLLLLSIVFLKVGVVNVTTPTLGPMVESDKVPTEQLNLTVAVDSNGFRITTANTQLPPVGGCPEPGPTVCLADRDAELDSKFVPSAGDAALEGALASYDWRELYNQLVRIKKQHDGETTINITADANVPYAAIVRVMDVARFRLAADSYAQNSEFWAARYATSGSRYASLFPDPVLAIAR